MYGISKVKVSQKQWPNEWQEKWWKKEKKEKYEKEKNIYEYA
jgi:hypothetical protein